MSKAKRGYTPQLRRELVSRLYQRAKFERVPMTVLANRIMEHALADQETSLTSPAEAPHPSTSK